jgi:hypothetical protein
MFVVVKSTLAVFICWLSSIKSNQIEGHLVMRRWRGHFIDAYCGQQIYPSGEIKYII